MNEKQKARAKKSGGVSIRVVGIITTVVAVALAFYAFALSSYIADTETALAAEEGQYVECSNAVDSLQAASDYLTNESRMFVSTGRRKHMDNYISELSASGRRERAVDVLRLNLVEDQEAITELEKALEASNGLAKSELAAMRLAAEYYEIGDLPEEVTTASTDLFRAAPDKESKLNAARGLVLSDNYDNAKQNIVGRVEASSSALLAELNNDLQDNENKMQALLFQLRIVVALLLCVILLFVLMLFMYVLQPLSRYVERLSGDEPLEPDGAYELHYLANAYNDIYEDNARRIERLRKHAEQDPLTGLSNRGGYDSFLATHTRNIALLLINVDNFRDFNEVYGHDTGDAVLVKLAEALTAAFRSTDFPCRIEGDQFAVIMTNTSAELRGAIIDKIDIVNSALADDSSDLPAVTLSVGAAFSTDDMSDQDIYHAANTALSQAKQTHGNGVVFYGESAASE